VKKQSKSLVLHLTLEREPFEEIVQKKKFTEYRDYKPYWTARLEGKGHKKIHFRNGYLKDSPEMDVECRGIKLVRKGRSAKYHIKLGRVSNLKRWR